MAPEEREELYDREIAPLLREVARKCEEGGLSIVAMVEWSPGNNGRTMSIREGAGIELSMVRWAGDAQGNADALIFALQKHGRKHGHNSICLHLLEQSMTGIPVGA